jgi:hypothetical protein
MVSVGQKVQLGRRIAARETPRAIVADEDAVSGD